MQIRDEILVDHIGDDIRKISLYEGAFEEALAAPADYLIISALADYYENEWTSVLASHGVEVAALSKSCEEDFRPILPCWISQPLFQLGNKRLVVFEPQTPTIEAAPDVWKVFQAVASHGGRASRLSAVMPILSADIVDPALMVRMLVFAAAALCARNPWAGVAIVANPNRINVATLAFENAKKGYYDPPWAEAAALQKMARIKRRFQHHETIVATAVQQEEPAPAAFGLTLRQFNLLRQYTGILYWYVNPILRSADVTSAEYAIYQPSIEAISTALAQLKNHRLDQTDLFRHMGQFPGIELIYQDGLTVEEAAFTSCSTVELTDPAAVFHLYIISRLAKDIHELSYFPNENEGLLDYGTQHLVHQVEELSHPDGVMTKVSAKEVLPNFSNFYYSHL